MSDLAIQTTNLTRCFGARAAVDGVNLAVPRGSVFGLLGRNGSGKTTTIRMLLGLLEPTRGSARLLGHDSRRLPPEVRGRVGYMAEAHPVYRWMSVAEAGRFQASFWPRWNDKVFRAVIDYFRLDGRAKAGSLSRGERAGLALALTLAPEPELLVLDDPALGLDPVARRALVEAMIYVVRRSDRTILLSTHLLADVERVADYVAVLDRGVLRAQCSVDTFRGRVRQFALRFAPPEAKPPEAKPAGAPPVLEGIPGVLHVRRGLGELRLTVANVTPETERLIQGLGALSVEEMPLSLEDAVIGYLGDRGARGFFLEDTSAIEAAAGAA